MILMFNLQSSLVHLGWFGCGSKIGTPNGTPWKHGLKPAVSWWFSFDPYPKVSFGEEGMAKLSPLSVILGESNSMKQSWDVPGGFAPVLGV